MLKSSLSPLYESIKKLLKRSRRVSTKRQMNDPLRPNSPFRGAGCFGVRNVKMLICPESFRASSAM